MPVCSDRGEDRRDTPCADREPSCTHGRFTNTYRPRPGTVRLPPPNRPVTDTHREICRPRHPTLGTEGDRGEGDPILIFDRLDQSPTCDSGPGPCDSTTGTHDPRLRERPTGLSGRVGVLRTCNLYAQTDHGPRQGSCVGVFQDTQ